MRSSNILILLVVLFVNRIMGQSRCEVYADFSGKILCYFHDTINNQLYVGGEFTQLYHNNNSNPQNISRTNVGKLDLFTKTFTPWAPIVSGGPVLAIQKVGNRVFLGGSFNKINNDSSYSLVSVDANTGATINTFTLGHGYSYRTSNNTDVDTVFTMDYNNGILAIGGIITKFNSTNINVPVILLNAPLNNNGYTINSINPVKNYPGVISISNSNETTKIKFYKRNGLTCLLTVARTNHAFSISNERYIHSINLSNNSYDLICSDPVMTAYHIKNDTLIILRKGNATTSNIQSSIITPTNTSMSGFSYGVKLNNTPGYFPINFSNYPFFGPAPNPCYNNNGTESYLAFFENRYFIGNLNQNSSCAANDYLQVYSKSCAPIPLISITDTILPKLTFNTLPWLNDQFIYHSIEKQGDKVIYLKGSTGNGSPMIETVCLLPDNVVTPYEKNNQVNFCRGKTYQFVEATKRNIYAYNWSYSGTGATITNNGNDTVTVSFNQNATAGNISVTAANSCGILSNTAQKNIIFQATPNLLVPSAAKLNCYNNKQANIVITSTNSPVSFQWTTPTNQTIFSASLTSTTIGSFTSMVTDNITGCTTVSTTLIQFDTIKPLITNVAPSYTANCTVGTLSINATSCAQAPCSDSLYWMIGNSNFQNPILFSPASPINYLIAKNKNLVNGCLSSFTTVVYYNDTIPSYNIISAINTPSIGLPQFNPVNCYSDSTLLSASSKPSAKIKWKRPNSDTLYNPCYGKIGGVYQLLITDTLNGCSNNSFFAQILTDQNPPNLTLQNNFAALNCSYNTATLQASSLSPGTNITWQSPAISFTSTNPAVTNQQAKYFAIATNTNNGCTKTDSVNLVLSNSLVINKSSDTTLCYGSSISFTAAPVGGTPPFTYLWTGGASTNTVTYNNNINNSKFAIKIIDNANCIGLDTIDIIIPNILSDSINTFKGCDALNPNGQIQIFGLGGIPPYRYSINGGVTFQNSNVFSNLGFGIYQLIIKDTLGCSHAATATISANSASPKVDFLVNSTLMQTDTFVIVDISNPRPDSIKWFFPPNIQYLNNSNPFSPIVLNHDTGMFYVKAVAYFGQCKDSLTKLIHFIKFDTNAVKTGINRGIKTFSIYPNPNNGQFNISLEFYKKQSFVIKIISVTGSEIMQTPSSYGDNALIPINMPISTPGNYFIKVISEFDSKQKSFILSN